MMQWTVKHSQRWLMGNSELSNECGASETFLEVKLVSIDHVYTQSFLVLQYRSSTSILMLDLHSPVAKVDCIERSVQHY